MKRAKTGIEQLQRKNKKKLSGLDKYVIFSFSVLLTYTVIEFVVSTITEISHDTLTTVLYGAFGGELLLCAIIKKYKLKRGDSYGEIEES